MRAITRIEIENWQSHRLTSIEPAPAGCLTALIGPTDSGKSAVMRALRWSYYGGTPLLRQGSRYATVVLHFDDGKKVTRERDRQTNRYAIIHPDGKAQVFESFGRDIPVEVQQALGVRPVSIGDMTIEANLARQHDPAFLVAGVSAPARARVIGQLAGVEAVDAASRDAGTDIHNAQREVKQLAEAIEKLEADIAEYEHLPAMGEVLKQLENILAKLDAVVARRERLSHLRDRFNRLENVRLMVNGVLARTGNGVIAADRIKTALQLLASMRHLVGYKDRLSLLADMKRNASRTLERTKGSDEANRLLAQASMVFSRRTLLADISVRNANLMVQKTRLRQVIQRMPSLDVVEQTFSEAEKAIRQRNELNALSAHKSKLESEKQLALVAKERAGVDYKDATQQYGELLMQAGRCPVCGSDTHEYHKEVV